MLNGAKSMNTSLASLLNLRSEYEDIIRRYRIPDQYKNGCIDSLEWFTKNGKGSNRLRSQYDRAIEIANIILKEYENETGNLSSLRGQEIAAL